MFLVFPEYSRAGVPNPRGRYGSEACQELGRTAGGEQQASGRSFTSLPIAHGRLAHGQGIYRRASVVWSGLVWQTITKHSRGTGS